MESRGFESQAAAVADLAMLRKQLYDPQQRRPRPDPARVRRLRAMLSLWWALGQEVLVGPYLTFATGALRVLVE